MSTPTLPSLPPIPNNPFNFSLPGTPSAPPLAKPTFVTGPLDSVATADVYKAKGGVINSIQDSLAKAGINIPDVLKGGKALATLLPIVAGLKNGSLLQDRNTLIQRLLQSSSAITGSFKLLGTDAQNSILGGLSSVGKYAVSLNGIARDVQTANFSDLNSIGTMVNRITGDATSMVVLDKDSTASLLAGTIKECTQFGIPNSFSTICATVTDGTIIKGAIGQSLGTVIGASDIASLKAMSQAVGDGSIPLINNNVIGQFGAQFNRSTAAILSSAPKDDANTLKDVLDTYSSVDSSWNVCTRATAGGDTQALNLTGLMSGSGDFKSLIANGVKQASDDTSKLYALAAVYPPTDVATELAQNFPKTVQTTGVPTTNTAAPTSNGIWQSLSNLMPGLNFAYDPTTGKQYVPATATASDVAAQVAAIPAATAQTPPPAAPAPKTVTAPNPGTQIDPNPRYGYRDNRMIWDPSWGPIPADQTNEWALAEWFDQEEARSATTIN